MCLLLLVLFCFCFCFLFVFVLLLLFFLGGGIGLSLQRIISNEDGNILIFYSAATLECHAAGTEFDTSHLVAVYGVSLYY